MDIGCMSFVFTDFFMLDRWDLHLYPVMPCHHQIVWCAPDLGKHPKPMYVTWVCMEIFPLQKYYVLIHIKFLTYTCSWGFSVPRVFPWYFDMLNCVIKIQYIVQFKNMIIKWHRKLSYYRGFPLNQPNSKESAKKLLQHSLEFKWCPYLKNKNYAVQIQPFFKCLNFSSCTNEFHVTYVIEAKWHEHTL